MTAISKDRITLDEAEALLKSVTRHSRCIEHVLPFRELSYNYPDHQQLIEQFGYRGLRWLQVEFHKTMARICTNKATATLEAAGKLRYGALSGAIAMAEHFQVGACSELSRLCWIQRSGLCHIMTGPSPVGEQQAGDKLWEIDAPSLQAGHNGTRVIAFPAKDTTKTQARMVHALVLANVAKNALRAGDPITKLLKMADVLVIDPYFNFVCPVSQLETRGAALLNYWKAFRQDYIMDSVHSPTTMSVQKRLIDKESALIHQEAAKLSAAFYRRSDAVSVRALISKALTSRFQPQLELALKDISPGTAWKIRLNDDLSYDCTTKDQIDSTETQLGHYGIQHAVKKNKKTKVKTVTLHNPDLQAVTLAAIRCWTGLSAVPVRLILEMAEVT
jgi:hypothetical protein